VLGDVSIGISDVRGRTQMIGVIEEDKMMIPLVLTHSRNVAGQGLRPLQSSYLHTIHIS